MNKLSFLHYLRFIRLRVSFEALETIVLSEYKGSAYRGCLGETLRGEVCKYPGLDCEKCGERFNCPFSQLFNSFVEPGHPHVRKYHKCPHPYIIDPMDDKRTELKQGENFGFDLTIIGDAARHLPLLFRVFGSMGETGIGKGHARFKATGLRVMQSDASFAPLLVFEQPESLALKDLPEIIVNKLVTLILETPLRVKEKGRLLRTAPGFGLFAERLAQRLALLAHFHCGAPWPDKGFGPFENTKTVNISQSDVKMVDWRRYSGTQDTAMNFDGLTGSITYEGEGLSSYTSLLAIGVWLHAGSTATFGLGKYSIAE